MNKDNNMVMEFIHGRMDLDIRVSGTIIKSAERVLMNGQTVDNILANG